MDILFVITAGTSSHAAACLADSLIWATPELSTTTVLVDRHKLFTAEDGVRNVVQPEAGVGEAFDAACGLKWAADNGVTYRYAMLLQDNCMVLSSGFASFLVAKVESSPLSVLGKQGAGVSAVAWSEAKTRLFDWGVPMGVWEEPPPVLSPGFLLLSADFVNLLRSKDLLLPANSAAWPCGYGAFLSWTAHLLGYYVVSWGLPHRPLPPLYVDGESPSLPAPNTLREDFGVFWPADRVPGYALSLLNEMYRQHRGEPPAFAVPTLRPEVTGPDLQNIAE